MSVRAAAHERTRRSLLDAAEEAFFSREWHQVPLTDIAAAAGVTKQTLLRHLGTKEGLHDAAAERAMRRVRDQRWSAPTNDASGAVDNLLDHYEEVGARALRVGAAGGDLGRQARQLHYDWVDHAFGAWLADDPHGHRRAVLIVLCDIHTWWLLSHDLELSRAEVRATLLQAIRGLLEEDT